MTNHRKDAESLSELDRVLLCHAVRQSARVELGAIGDTLKIWRLRGESDDFFATRIRYRLLDIMHDHQAALERTTQLAEFLNGNEEDH
jgi:hypothetical protein